MQTKNPPTSSLSPLVKKARPYTKLESVKKISNGKARQNLVMHPQLQKKHRLRDEDVRRANLAMQGERSLDGLNGRPNLRKTSTQGIKAARRSNKNLRRRNGDWSVNGLKQSYYKRRLYAKMFNTKRSSYERRAKNVTKLESKNSDENFYILLETLRHLQLYSANRGITILTTVHC